MLTRHTKGHFHVDIFLGVGFRLRNDPLSLSGEATGRPRRHDLQEIKRKDPAACQPRTKKNSVICNHAW